MCLLLSSSFKVECSVQNYLDPSALDTCRSITVARESLPVNFSRCCLGVYADPTLQRLLRHPCAPIPYLQVCSCLSLSYASLMFLRVIYLTEAKITSAGLGAMSWLTFGLGAAVGVYGLVTEISMLDM